MTRHISGQIPTRPRDRRAGQRRHAAASAAHIRESARYRARGGLDDAVRVTIAVAALPRGAQIEIDCILDLGTSDTLKSRKGIARTNRKRHSNY